jgi:hypothetical protein
VQESVSGFKTGRFDYKRFFEENPGVVIKVCDGMHRVDALQTLSNETDETIYLEVPLNLLPSQPKDFDLNRLAYHLNNSTHEHVAQTLVSDLTFLKRLHDLYFEEHERKVQKYEADKAAWKYVLPRASTDVRELDCDADDDFSDMPKLIPVRPSFKFTVCATELCQAIVPSDGGDLCGLCRGPRTRVLRGN